MDRMLLIFWGYAEVGLLPDWRRKAVVACRASVQVRESSQCQRIKLQPQNTETQMRKLKIIEHISLDGVIQHSGDDDDFPYADWTAPYRTPAGRDAMIAAYGE